MIRLAALASLMCVTSVASAQCPSQWLPGDAGSLIDGNINAIVNFDPDGAAGPLPVWNIVGGGVVVPGFARAKLAAYDGTRWRSLDLPDPTGFVSAMIVFGGELYVAGSFTTIAGVAATNIAKWNGTTWSPVGVGIQGTAINALGVFNNSLIAGGNFTASGATPLADLARWSGTAWVNIGSTSTGGVVNALTAIGNSLYVGGEFTSVGGVAITNLARWNGTTWSQCGQPNGAVRTLASFASVNIGSERVFVGGAFSAIGTVSNDAALFVPNTGAWSSLGTVLLASPVRFLVRSTGINTYELAGIWRLCNPLPGGACGNSVYTLSGTIWTALSNSVLEANALGISGGQYIVGGSAGVNTSAFRRYNGTNWIDPPAVGAPAELTALAEGANGEVFGGTWDGQASITTGLEHFVIRRDPASGVWTRLGSFVGVGSRIHSLLRMPSGDLIAGGFFAQVNANPIANIARWNGTSWSSLGAGLNEIVYALERMPNGDVIAAGTFSAAGAVSVSGLARWDGAGWSPVVGGLVGDAFALKQLPDGSLIVGGVFTAAGSINASNIARFDGTNWFALGSGIVAQSMQPGVFAIERLPNGTIVAGGRFESAGGLPATNIARWNGSAWSAMGPGLGATFSADGVAALQTLPSGELLAGGRFTSPSANIAKWNGSAWVAANAGGLPGTPQFSGFWGVNDLLALSDGRVAAAGAFTNTDTQVSAYYARYGALPGCSTCDSIDFNNDTSLFDPADIDAIFSVFSEGPCIPAGATCNDVDFNNDTSLFDPCDIDSFLLAFSEGPCTLCGQ
jgi:hypothetical protein